MSYTVIPPHLPKRLTISFPIWGLFDTNDGGMYHNLDKMVREHVERGFNCIRLEGGAGLTHDLEGKPRGPIHIHAPFGIYSSGVRQLFCFGGDGYCDVLQRLTELCRVCQKYGVFVIISSWYCLHTYWYADNEINKEIFDTPAEEMFMTFAKFLHYILVHLEKLGLDDRIAFAEIFNEVPAVPTFLADRSGRDLSHVDFCAKHCEAISWLRSKHPQLLFAVDSDNVTDAEIEKIPDSLQIFNGHNYFLWGVYADTLESGNLHKPPFFRCEISAEDVRLQRDGLTRMAKHSEGWYRRVAGGVDLNTAAIPALEEHLSARLEDNWDSYVQRLERFCEGYRKVLAAHPGIRLVCGEGVTYCSSPVLHWEEKSTRFWELAEMAMDKYKALDLWGTVIKTCCGPEDPSWTICKDKIRELNLRFLENS